MSIWERNLSPPQCNHGLLAWYHTVNIIILPEVGKGCKREGVSVLLYINMFNYLKFFPHRLHQGLKTASGQLDLFWQFFFPRGQQLVWTHPTTCVQEMPKNKLSKWVQNQQNPQRGQVQSCRQQLYLWTALMTHSAVGFSWMRSFINVSPSRHLSSGEKKTDKEEKDGKHWVKHLWCNPFGHTLCYFSFYPVGSLSATEDNQHHN